MKKADRQKLFDKYGGRCAYCGCALEKGWHVDEIEPIRRNWKIIEGGYYHKVTKERATNSQMRSTNEGDQFFTDYEYKPTRQVPDGCEHPERLHIDNQNPACASCNINKHSDSLEGFRKLIAGFMKHLNEVNTQYKIAKRYGLVVEDIKPVVFYFETLNQPNHER